jgi:hypothetical protein
VLGGFGERWPLRPVRMTTHEPEARSGKIWLRTLPPREKVTGDRPCGWEWGLKNGDDEIEKGACLCTVDWLW